MIKAIASVMGLPEVQVTQHDRNLAVAGLRPVSGRGPSAASYEAPDMSRLVTGVAASPAIKDTVQVVNKYGGLKCRPGISHRVDRQGKSIVKYPKNWELIGIPISNPEELLALPAGHTFHDALTALINVVSDDKHRESSKEPIVDRELLRLIPYGIRVTFWGPNPLAEIMISTAGKGPSELHSYSANEELSDEELMVEMRKEAADPDYYRRKLQAKEPDLFQIRYFTEQTILALADLLKS